MGWWEQERILLGDGPLDLAEDFLQGISREYLQEQRRKPTLEEVLASLVTVLRSRADEFVSDGPGVVVTGIVAKTKKGAKKQPQPGDVFFVPLGGGDHAFGRLTPQLSVADFFELRSSKPVRASRLMNISTFRLPGLVMLDPLKDGRWRIIDHVPYNEEFQIQPFRIAGQIECGNKLVSGFIDPSSRLRPASGAELQSVPQHSLWNAELVEKELRERLAHSPKI